MMTATTAITLLREPLAPSTGVVSDHQRQHEGRGEDEPAPCGAGKREQDRQVS